jgi:hypothetical protein
MMYHQVRFGRGAARGHGKTLCYRVIRQAVYAVPAKTQCIVWSIAVTLQLIANEQRAVVCNLGLVFKTWQEV